MRMQKTFPLCQAFHAVRTLTFATALAVGGSVSAEAVQNKVHEASEVPAGMTAADGASLRGQIVALHYRDAAATYPLKIDPTVVQQAYLKASNSRGRTNFGSSVAISGDTVIVGAPAEPSNATGVNGDQTNRSASSAGAAYVFVRSGSIWSQQAYLKASNTDRLDSFGSSVAISGDTVVVGAHEEGSDAIGVNGDQTNNSAPASGAAYVFVRSGSTWSQQAYLKASNTGTGDEFGAVAISGDTVVVGAAGESSNATGVNGDQTNNSAPHAGAAYVFVRSGSTWTLQAYLKASNTGAWDNFGSSVAISEDTVVVGALEEGSDAIGVNGDQTNNTAPASGAAYVFVRSGTTWSQQAYLKASNTGQADRFGHVAISGDKAVIGAHFEASNSTGVNGDQTNNLAPGSGAAYVFVRHGSTWSQQAYLKASNTDPELQDFFDEFGLRVAIYKDTVVVGAPLEDSNARGVNGDETNRDAPGSGAAYLFVYNGSTWIQQAYLKASNTVGDPRFPFAGDWFGQSVAVSGDTVVAGAPFESSSATGVNGDQTNDHINSDAPESGAAYVFTVAPSVFEVPTLGSQGLAVLLLALAAAGVLGLRRRYSAP